MSHSFVHSIFDFVVVTLDLTIPEWLLEVSEQKPADGAKSELRDELAETPSLFTGEHNPGEAFLTSRKVFEHHLAYMLRSVSYDQLSDLYRYLH